MLSRFQLENNGTQRTDRHTDGRTDGRTDRIAISISRVSVLTCNKNAVILLEYAAVAVMLVKASQFNPLMGTSKPYSNTVIDTLAVDKWAVTFGQRGGGWAGCGPAQSPPRCTKCNSPPISGQCTNFILFDVALLLPPNSKGLRHIGRVVCRREADLEGRI